METKRIVFNKRFLVLLLLLLALNGILFVKAQKDNNYGLDLSLASTTLTWDSSGEQVTSELLLDARSCLEIYYKWLETYQNTEAEKAIESLTIEMERLSEIANTSEEEQMDLIAVKTLLNQFTYLINYQSYLEMIQNNKENALSFSIFNESDSFSYRNIMLTAAQFERMDGVELSIDANGALEAFVSWPITDYLLLILILWFVFSFLQERKAGLWSMVYCSKKGRFALTLRRMGILTGACALGTILFYGSNLVLSNIVFGSFGSLDRAVQSSELFQKLPVRLTVKSFLAQYFAVRFVTLFMLALLAWLLLLAVPKIKYAAAGLALFCMAEYLLFTYLPVQSVMNAFKYFNIFTYIRVSELYTNYLNIDLFGYPFGIRQVSLYMMILLIVAASLGIFLITGYGRPVCSASHLERVIYMVQTQLDHMRTKLNLWGLEWYKYLFLQRGIVILILLLAVAANLTYLSLVKANSQGEYAARHFLTEIEGELGDSILMTVWEKQSEIDDVISEYEAAKVDYSEGKIEYAEFSVYERKYETAQIKQEGLNIVSLRISELTELKRSNNLSLWLIDESTYESLWGNANRVNRILVALTEFLTMLLLVGGSAAFEKKSNMLFCTRATPKGRKKLHLCRLGVTASLTIIVWGIITVLQASSFWNRYAGKILHTDDGIGFFASVKMLVQNYTQTSLSAPVQSLSRFADFPFTVSIGGYYILQTIVWLLVLLAYSVAIMEITEKLFLKIEE